MQLSRCHDEQARKPQQHATVVLPRVGARDDLPTPSAYYDLLGLLCAHLDIWHTVYNHVLADAEAIVEWFKGSGLRPFLSPLPLAHEPGSHI